MNRELLMCEPRHFRVDYEINPYMHTADQPDPASASAEHDAIVAAHLAAGRKVEVLPAAPECPDMVYTANAAVVRGHRAVLATLPPQRAAETPYHRQWLAERGYDVRQPDHPFSGQGDALAWGEVLFAGHGQRTDQRAHPLLADHLGYHVVALRTTGPRWYDLDLALAVLSERLLAYCPAAFDAPSRRRIEDAGAELIEVTEDEAARFALNLVSDGQTVTMTSGTPVLADTVRANGFTVVELDTGELRKGGGGVRCTALTLDNPGGPA